jgi:cell division protein FtsW (lipid II flippase)
MDLFHGSMTSMNSNQDVPVLVSPRAIIIGCGVTATLAGLAYLGLVEAPATYLVMNGAALLLAVSLVWLVASSGALIDRAAGPICIGGALLLVGTLLLGPEVEGVRRWLALGPVLLQPGLVVLPLMLAVFSRSPNGLATVGIATAVVVLALQPDRALSSALAAGLFVLLTLERRPSTGVIFLVALGASVATFLQPDALPAVEHVEGVYADALSSGIAESILVFVGTGLLLLPGWFAFHSAADQRARLAAFGAFWVVVVMAAAVGDYPTPLLGYGPSAILGHFLGSLAFTTRSSRP